MKTELKDFGKTFQKIEKKHYNLFYLSLQKQQNRLNHNIFLLKVLTRCKGRDEVLTKMAKTNTLLYVCNDIFSIRNGKSIY